MNEITSRKNPLIVHLKKLGADSDYRREHGEFLCDGDKLLREALTYGAEITSILFSGSQMPDIPDDVPIYKVDHELIKTVSPLTTPQSVVFSCRKSQNSDRLYKEGFKIILEGLQDPGNVGTIIRTAAAFGVKDVLLTGTCADPYNPKTIRASMGAVFRQHVEEVELDDISELKKQGCRLFGAALAPESRRISEVSLQNAAVAIGSEGRGLSDALLSLCDEKVIIPMLPTSESLNAAIAAAVVMWEAEKNKL